jgi:hypothetical protein
VSGGFRDTLRGRDIRESSQAKVPNTRKADVAHNATSAVTANTANTANALQGHGPGDFVPSGEYERVVAKMQAGDEREIVRNGPLSIYARCATVGVNDTLRMFAKTDVDGAIMYASWGDSRDGTSATDFLDTTTPEGNASSTTARTGAPTVRAARSLRPA